jgi:GH18 family chitinase
MGNKDNVIAKGAEFVFGGKKLRMIFTTKAVKYLKDCQGGYYKAINKMDDENGDVDFDVLADVLYAGFLINKDDSITKEFINATLEEMPYFEVKAMAVKEIIAAATGSYPDAKQDSGGPQ